MSILEKDDTGGIVENALTSSTLLLTASSLALIGYLIYDRFQFKDVWAKHGVKQPKFSTFEGLDVRTEFNKLLNDHGDTVGIVRPEEGMVLMTRDLTLLKQILVKDFNNFVNRSQNFVSKTPLDRSVFFAEDLAWRRLRQITSPSFSTGKLKALSKNIEESATSLTDFFVNCAQKRTLVPLKVTTSQYTSEIIARTAFGFQTNAIGNDDDEFSRYSRSMLKTRSKFARVALLLLENIPGLSRFMIKTLGVDYLDPITTDSYKYFLSILTRTISERKHYEINGSRKPADLFQSLVAAQVNATDSDDDSKSTKRLTDDEIVGQSMLIIFAAFETTSSTLQFFLYHMAIYPEIQEKVYQEIQTTVKSTTPTHEELGQLKYMEQVINETLRKFTIVPVVTRGTKETRTYGSVTIPKGTTIFVPITSIHKNPKHWPNPEKFDPERFSEEAKSARDPLSFMPFGAGPRLCLGMRLAYLEMKMALVHVMRQVVFTLNDETEPKKGHQFKLSWQGLATPEKPLKVACIVRD